MHEKHARALALGIGMVVTAAAFLFAGRDGPEPTRASAASMPAATRGQALFVSLDCVRCHSFRGVGKPSGALDDAESLTDPKALEQWITAAPEVAGGLSRKARDAKAAYAALPREDLDALIAWLGSAD